MKLSHFRNVVAIAERGSLRAAARALDMAQPVLTRSLQELEHELGAPLFERRARGMEPTPLGEAFIRRAAGVLNDVRRMQEESEQLRGGLHGRVVAGLSIAIHLALLPRALGPFQSRYPDVALHLMEGFYPTLERGLVDGSVDFYIGPHPEEALAPDLMEEKLFDNQRVIVGRRGHPARQSKCLAELVDARWITTTITLQAKRELGALFAHHDLPPPRLALQTQSALTLLIALGSTDLLAMVPVQWMSSAITARELDVIPVRELLPAPPLVLVRRKSVPLTPAAQTFADLLTQASPDLS